MSPQCTSLPVEEDDVAEPCTILANVTIMSSSERSVIDPSSSSAVILDYDNEGKHTKKQYISTVLRLRVLQAKNLGINSV